MKKLFFTNSYNYVKVCIVFFLFFGLIYSCKKDGSEALTDKQLIQRAKNWYEVQSKKISTSITSSKGDKTALQFAPDWETAVVENIAGRSVINAPVATNLNGVARDKAKFNLLITGINNAFTSKTVKSDLTAKLSTKELYTTAFTNNPLDAKRDVVVTVFDEQFRIEGGATYSNGTRTPLSIAPSRTKMSKSEIVGKGRLEAIPNLIANPPVAGDCTHWYLETNIYDSKGNLLYVYETDYGITCEGDGQTGVDCEDIYSLINGIATSEDLGADLIEETATTRKKDYKWMYLQSLAWYYVSVESGVHKKVGSTWQWDSLTHSRVYRVGSVIGGTLTMTLNSATPTLGVYYAGMTINYDFYGIAVCKGSPIDYSRPDVTQDSPVWDSTVYP